ncbi:MAG: M20 family metallopeptidase [Roseovarius sp.]|nr:M20 family metallopeptidase [Roseovarius sp.]
MGIHPGIEEHAEEIKEIFRDLHAHPEIGFEERRTSGIVAERLREYGVDEVHTGIGETGVVGIIRGGGQGNRCIGLRADMDALPIHEATDLPYASKNDGVMHACGHDGHTSMLLGAARHLSRTRDFDGTAMLVFQPAEEGLGGARSMLAEGLFERHPCDEIYGIHNFPSGEAGKVRICKGRAMAGASFFDIRVSGRGSHAAMPQMSRDSLVAASALVGELQTIVSRNVTPTDTCVLSVTTFHSGSAYNVIPGSAELSGTIRYFDDAVVELAESRMRDICEGISQSHGVDAGLDLRNVFDVLINDPDLSDAYLKAAADVVGVENVAETKIPVTGSEDFADMLKVVPGAYCVLGHSCRVPLHNPGFVLDPEIIPVGASILSRIVETRLPLQN